LFGTVSESSDISSGGFGSGEGEERIGTGESEEREGSSGVFVGFFLRGGWCKKRIGSTM